jgi:hypothetical protein
MTPSEPQPGIGSCPHCGSQEFFEVWEGRTWTSGSFVVDGFADGDLTFEPGDGVDFGKGNSRWECAGCDAEITPDELVRAS